MQWVDGKVIEIKAWSEGLFSLFIDAPIPPFNAGQFTQIGLNIDGKRVGRPYSFVNGPEERPLEFIYVIVPGGTLTSALSNLKVGDTISVLARPSGLFTLNEVPDGKHLWLMATGTALGVFLSILKTDLPWQRFEKVTLVHGVRECANLSHQPLINSWIKAHPGQFNYIPMATRDDAEGVLKGRIPHAIENGNLEATANLQFDPQTSQVMLCGNPAMITDTREALEAKGLRKNLRKEPGHITVENYWKE